MFVILSLSPSFLDKSREKQVLALDREADDAIVSVSEKHERYRTCKSVQSFLLFSYLKSDTKM